MEKSRASEVDCSLVVKKIVCFQESVQKLEYELKAVTVDAVSASQYLVRIEDPVAFDGRGRFQRYQDEGGAGRPSANEIPAPFLTSQGKSAFAQREAAEPYNLYADTGTPEESLLFVVKSMLEVEAVELIACMVRCAGAQTLSITIPFVDPSGHPKHQNIRPNQTHP